MKTFDFKTVEGCELSLEVQEKGFTLRTKTEILIDASIITKDSRIDLTTRNKYRNLRYRLQAKKTVFDKSYKIVKAKVKV